MAKTALQGHPVNTIGDLPEVGDRLPSITLTNGALEDVGLDHFEGTKVLNIFPSVDTGICAMSVRKFNEYAAEKGDLHVLNISVDLPFALGRFSDAENIDTAVNLSAFRSDFGDRLGVTMVDGPMRGLYARAVIVVDDQQTVRYVELVPEIAQEPDYDAVRTAIEA